MNTNNKEVIELLRIAKGEIIEGYTNGPVDLIQKVIDSLQDNEDTEVQEVKLHKSENPLEFEPPHNMDFPEDCWCQNISSKPSSKVEKLKEFKAQMLERGGTSSIRKELLTVWDLVKLTEILIEDEE